MIEILDGTHETVNFNNSSTIKFYRNYTPEDFPEHWHIAGEIIAPQINTYTVKVGQNTINLNVGDVLIIAPGELHSIKAPTVGVRYIVNYDASHFEHIRDMNFIVSMLQPYYLVQSSKKPELAKKLVDYLKKIEDEYFSNVPYRDSEICSLFLHFMVLLGRNTMQSKQFKDIDISRNQEYSDRFINVCNYIRDHCTENLTIDHISAYAGFSKFHFLRLFKKFTGSTCHEYIISNRIRLAQSLLNDPKISITDVSSKSGFNSLATFNRTFKNQLGCTPSEYRNLKQHS